MSPDSLNNSLEALRRSLEGDLFTDESYRILHATDASAYRELPLAVARPKTPEDIRKLVTFARENGTSLIPRTAGTSLAGQVVGNGIVVDVSKYLNKILEINSEERWVRVEPGVVLDELNMAVARHGLFFGPETSTSNRCMIGGMVGNNACGAHSIIYGSTRDHLISVKAILSDGSDAEFKPLPPEEFERKCDGDTLEAAIYRNIRELLKDTGVQEEIRMEFPDPTIKRRNTGYAIDQLLDCYPFSANGQPFNFCKILAGSEGTLAFSTEIKLNLVPLPPKQKVLLCAHFKTLEEALQGNLVALKHNPGAVELMDKFILDCTRDNIEQRRNRFFIEGDPGAILIIEFARETREELEAITGKLTEDFRSAGLGYHYPVVTGADIPRVWALRKAGLGVLTNIPGDAKPVSVIEDTAVNPENLPQYIAEFKEILAGHGLECVYHAHIATGELHLRPVLNLKDPADVKKFRAIATDTARLVKKFRGSFSGEHGDGRVRGEFIPLMVGEKNYEILRKIKQAWDPGNIFNPGKITGTAPMDTSLRYEPGRATRQFQTVFDFSHDGGILRAAEKCNGSGDCRKSHLIGGTMCPSYMASKDENATTRARANILREFLTRSERKNPFGHKEIYDVMDLCLSCKGCKSECPSNVDISRYKAEFLQHYYDEHGVPLRSLAVANITRLNRLGAILPGVYNFMVRNHLISGLMKKVLGMAPQRPLPPLHPYTLTTWLNKYNQNLPAGLPLRQVWLFIDEFTEFNDVPVGIATVKLLNALGYKVLTCQHPESGRTYLSKGLVRAARKYAIDNVMTFKDKVSEDVPLIGIEPSAILSFRDEYPDLVGPELKDFATKLSKNCLMFDEFFMREIKSGNISKDHFTRSKANIKLHGHCHQKALSTTGPTKEMLSFPENYTVEEIPSGCCGMAGSFGYEKEHYELSMKVGELVLFPAVRQSDQTFIIAAPGTSCRHQIKDGTGREALHPVEVMWSAIDPSLRPG
ncbi:MAG: FAD-binding protein [Bacteroidales bacterium]|nr:FAD-binding protein [Bacteroidales bacterium]